MTDYISRRQTVGLNTDREELNAKFDAIARYFGGPWLEAEGDHPLQKLWKCRDALATNELLNFGDAIENIEKVDSDWLLEQIAIVKSGDEGNRAGAIFEIMGLNLFVHAENTVEFAKASNPGYDGVVKLSDGSSLLVSVKNHSMTSYERFFQKNAKEIDEQFQGWLKQHSASGTELRVLAVKHLDSTAWADIKADLKNILDGQLNGTASTYKPKGKAQIHLKNISPEYQPLGVHNISSMTFVAAKAHKNEQDKFVEDLRKGCSNLVKHTRNEPDTACPVLLVRLCASASMVNCKAWAEDYFKEYPKERVGLILLYQAAVVNSPDNTALTHYYLPIIGPQFHIWANPSNGQVRRLPNMGVLVGVIISEPSQKIIMADNGQRITMDGTYSYQRGDIYRRYEMQNGTLTANLSNPAPGIKIHAEVEIGGQSAGLQMISSDRGELQLLT